MNRLELQQLAEDRILDAQALLAAQRWSGAFYLAGYAVECALKSCVLVRIANTGIIFQNKKFVEQCWTHDLEVLVKAAELEEILGLAMAANSILLGHWNTVKDWNEMSRYQQKSQAEAERLFLAVADPTNGVLPWIRSRW